LALFPLLLALCPAARVIASIGDERNALLMVSVKVAFGPGAPELTLSAARLYLLDEDSKIEASRSSSWAPRPEGAAVGPGATPPGSNGRRALCVAHREPAATRL
jgi:hypothetical protein